MSEPLPTADDHYRRVMLSVLGQLARRGYRFSPEEGIDLVHEFLADHWQRVHETYDPTKGNFTTYLASAFFYDARRRLAKMASWRARLVDAKSLAEIASRQPGPADVAEWKESLERMRDALDALDEPHRVVLIEWLTGGHSSERHLSIRYGLSRHKVREMLIDALGQVATRFGEVKHLDRREIEIADCLWREGLSARATAVRLGLPLEEVLSTRRRLAKRLLDTVRSLPGYSSPSDSVRRKWHE